MKVQILYHPVSETARIVEEFVGNYKRQTGHDIELISLETVEGSDLARLHDIVQYPAILAINERGELVKDWQGETLPLLDEVTAYATV
jgi:hypothetical protein